MRFNWKIFGLSVVVLTVLSVWYLYMKNMFVNGYGILLGVVMFAVIASSILGVYETVIAKVLARQNQDLSQIVPPSLDPQRYVKTFVFWGGLFGLLNGYFLTQYHFDWVNFVFYFLSIGFLISAIKYLKDKSIRDFVKG